MPVTDATLVTIFAMSVYSTYAYLPAYIHNVLVYLVTLKDSHLDITMVTDACLQVIVYNSLEQLKILKTAIKFLTLYKTRINCNAEHN